MKDAPMDLFLLLINVQLSIVQFQVVSFLGKFVTVCSTLPLKYDHETVPDFFSSCYMKFLSLFMKGLQRGPGGDCGHVRA
jgi:hypothetical protein